MSLKDKATPSFLPVKRGRQEGVSFFYSAKHQFDKQGKFFWRLVKEAGWTKEQMTELLITKFNATHWNELDPSQRRQAICIMQYFVKKHLEVKEKRLRQRINVVWLKAGFTRDELHNAMSEWGLGASLRALGYKDLCSVMSNVNKIIKNQKNTQGVIYGNQKK